MSEQKNSLEGLISQLQQERDELQLQMHLASMDAKDEYDRISTKVDQLAEQFEPVRDAVEESAANVWSALSMAAEEMVAGFDRVRKAVDEST